ncbi:pimeloyl-ACP methyl ester carboxylesterase [Bradyrhizobium sp. USDA 329]
MPDLPDIPLPAGIRSRTIDGINGLRMHVLEAGFETKGRRCILLLHGFPELAFSWRKVMPALADAGYHVIAPDQRGYGRTTGWSAEYGSDLAPFSLFNLVRDALALVSAFGYRQVDVVGHDFGSPVAAWCALIRPDVFRFGDDDERAVRRTAAAAVWHRRHAGQACGRRPRSSRACRAAAAAKTLSMVLLDTRGERRHASRAAGRA